MYNYHHYYYYYYYYSFFSSLCCCCLLIITLLDIAILCICKYQKTKHKIYEVVCIEFTESKFKICDLCTLSTGTQLID